jgi:hypothetical protein
MRLVHAYCSKCRAKAAPQNPEEPDRLRWRMPSGWTLVPQSNGVWGRHCPECGEKDRQTYLALLRSPDRMPVVLQAVLDFWRQYPEKQLTEVIALAAKLRKKPLAGLHDSDLAGVLRIWTVNESHREYLRKHELPSLDPWSIGSEAEAPATPRARRSAGDN